jgi:hypothetical protein
VAASRKDTDCPSGRQIAWADHPLDGLARSRRVRPTFPFPYEGARGARIRLAVG